MITALALVTLGALLGIGGLMVWARIDGELSRRALARSYVQLQQLRREARIQQVTQDAVQQMLKAARRQQ